MSSYFEVRGGNKLQGELRINGAKNAILPMLCAALLTKEECIFTDAPDISDVQILLDIIEELGAKVSRDKIAQTITVQAENIDPKKLGLSNQARQMRASILLLGPLLARFGEATIPTPGGCIIGARPNHVHLEGFENFGGVVEEGDGYIKITMPNKKLKNNNVFLPEASVTGTENLAIFLAGKAEESHIHFGATEPHVSGFMHMLADMGADMKGIGSQDVTIIGSENLKGGTFKVPSDGILAGTYIIAAIITEGDVWFHNVDHRELFFFYDMLKRMRVSFEIKNDSIHIYGKQNLKAIKRIRTAVYPAFLPDLQSPAGLLLTQADGKSMIFETLYEGRLTYLQELEKMGANVQVLNPHQAVVWGKTSLQGVEVQSWDLRAGATMVLAGLIADGVTKVTNINYIDRGYENFAGNLQKLGADIRRVEV